MPEPAPPGAVENAAVARPETLTPEAVAAVLADFRTWLTENATPAEEQPLDLQAVLAQFTALRHEVNLQTRATRAQQEQSAQALSQLADTVEALERAGENARQARQATEDEVVRPVLKALVDLYDALALARRELLRLQEQSLPHLAALAAPPEPVPELPPAPEVPTAVPRSIAGPSWLGRLFGARPPEPSPDDETAAALRRAVEQQRETLTAWRHRLLESEQRRREAAEAAGRVRSFLDSVITGYTMSVQRVERALQQQGLEVIPAVGEPFDPEEMEVLDAVTDSGRPAGEVLEEVRRGYRWRGRVFRYAQVRVAKGNSSV
jgi:molecular chaperone GrpE